MIVRNALAFICACICILPALAWASQAGDVEGVALTIYNDNLALIRETRQFELSSGTQNLELMDVSGQLRPETVHLTLPAGWDVALLEQNYDYDLVSSDKLLEKFVGKQITLVDDEHNLTTTGTLLSVADGLVLNHDGEILLNPPGRIVLPTGAADGLLLRPTLSWLVHSPRAGSPKAEIAYLSGGLAWNADYVLMLNADDKAAGLEGWVTVNNNSGTDYKDAKLKLVAGQVNQVHKDEMMDYSTQPAAEAAGEGGGFVEEQFFEYHLYDLQRPTTLRNNQQKQVGLLTAADIPIKKLLLFDGQNGGDVRVNVEFMNSETNGMGLPLPAGTVRVFKQDSSGSAQFIGEDAIEHTPKDEKVSLFVGNAFDIKGETVQTSYEDIGNGYKEARKITLKNHKENEDVTVTVRVEVYGDWKFITTNYDYKMVDAFHAEFEVPVKAGGEAELDYEFRVTWK
jgi:hypothetical protein